MYIFAHFSIVNQWLYKPTSTQDFLSPFSEPSEPEALSIVARKTADLSRRHHRVSPLNEV